MTMFDVIQRAIPGVSEEEAEYILWSYTPYPVGGITAKSLYQAARRVKRAFTNHRKLCELCFNLAQEQKSLCIKCENAMKEVI